MNFDKLHSSLGHERSSASHVVLTLIPLRGLEALEETLGSLVASLEQRATQKLHTAARGAAVAAREASGRS